MKGDKYSNAIERHMANLKGAKALAKRLRKGAHSDADVDSRGNYYRDFQVEEADKVDRVSRRSSSPSQMNNL